MRTFLDLYPKNVIKFQIIRNSSLMNKDKKWMLMTYYCPTHGDAGRVEPLQLTRQEVSHSLFNKTKSKKDIKEL